MGKWQTIIDLIVNKWEFAVGHFQEIRRVGFRGGRKIVTLGNSKTGRVYAKRTLHDCAIDASPPPPNPADKGFIDFLAPVFLLSF